MIKIKFKKLKKFQENIINSPKFAHYVISRKHIKRWSSFSKPIIINKNTKLFKISKYFSLNQEIKTKEKLIFQNMPINLNKKQHILYVLKKALFANNLNEAKQQVLSRKVYVNHKVITEPFYFVKEGDLIQLKNQFLKKQWNKTAFFTKKETIQLKATIPYNYEISFSTISLVINFILAKLLNGKVLHCKCNNLGSSPSLA